LLFKPYTKQELAAVLQGLAEETVGTKVFHEKAFQIAASKIDKVSGDIRVCFEIMRQVV
jgi:Cdc6-like AAA superfamily ATPase